MSKYKFIEEKVETMSLPELRVFLNILKNKSQELMSTLEIAGRIKDLEIVYKSIQKLTNRASEFDGGSFLILVVGPVKSGKSTLVNLNSTRSCQPHSFSGVYGASFYHIKRTGRIHYFHLLYRR